MHEQQVRVRWFFLFLSRFPDLNWPWQCLFVECYHSMNLLGYLRSKKVPVPACVCESLSNLSKMSDCFPCFIQNGVVHKTEKIYRISVRKWSSFSLLMYSETRYNKSTSLLRLYWCLFYLYVWWFRRVWSLLVINVHPKFWLPEFPCVFYTSRDAVFWRCYIMA